MSGAVDQFADAIGDQQLLRAAVAVSAVPLR